MAKSSINIQPVKSNSELHNQREIKLDYNFFDLQKNNESWKVASIGEREKTIKDFCKKTSGRKLQKNATPIREAVVNLNENHSMDDLKKLSSSIKDQFEVEVFQIYIHRDEGKNKNELNYHAHLVIDWQDKETGKVKRHGKQAMSQLQTLVATSLQMERGQLKVNSNRERLAPIEYKRQQEELKLKTLQTEVSVLEQKKNRAAETNQAAQKEYDLFKDTFKQRTEAIARKGIQLDWNAIKEEATTLSGAVKLQQGWLNQQQQEIKAFENQIEALSSASNQYQRGQQHQEYLKFKTTIKNLASEQTSAQKVETNIQHLRKEIEAIEEGK